MIRTQISFDADLYRRAQRVAKRRRISLAELCRAGLREVLARESSEPDYMQFAGIAASGDPHASSKIDEVVYGREQP